MRKLRHRKENTSKSRRITRKTRRDPSFLRINKRCRKEISKTRKKHLQYCSYYDSIVPTIINR